MSRTRAGERTRWLRAFGAVIRELRNERGLSQEALGFRSQLSQTYISQLEAGNRNPTVWVLYRLAKGLEVGQADILIQAEGFFTGT